MKSLETPGSRTSEFRAVLVYIALMVANATPWVQFSIEEMGMAFGLLGLYGGGRAAQKWQAVRTTPRTGEGA